MLNMPHHRLGPMPGVGLRARVMLVQPIQKAPPPAHFVVFATEKGGPGKSPPALHTAVALLKAGQRVATVDLDSRQKTFTHYIENRRAWAERTRIQLELPTHCCVERADTSSMEANETTDVASFSSAVSAIERTHDFVVVDTPGNDSFLMRLAHSIGGTPV